MKRRNLSGIPKAYYLGALFAGVFLTFAFPPFGYAPVAWVAFVPLICLSCAGRMSTREAALMGFLFGLSHRLTSMYWIEYVLKKYGHLPVVAAFALCLALCAYLALYPALFAALARRLSASGFSLFALPAIWVILEWIQAKALTGFPWNLLGYSQGSLLWIMQSADLWGVYGVSFAVLLTNTVIADLVMRRRFPIFQAICLFLLGLFVFAYGHHKIDGYGAGGKTGDCFETAIIQGNIDQSVKWNAEFRKTTLEKYLNLSEQAILRDKDIKLIVWPETAMPFFFEFDPDFGSLIRQFAQKEEVGLFFGSPGVVLKEGGEAEGFLNNAYLIDDRGITVGKYSKEHLVPFGEYVPLGRLLFFVKKLVPLAGDFIPGKTSGIVEYGRIRMGVLICYEAIFPELARKRVQSGANVIINISNDAWFGKTAAPFQHLEMARWRAVETRRPLLRSTNTGISAFIDPLGRIESSLGLFQEGSLIRRVCTAEGSTIYARFGDWPVLLWALTTLVTLLYLQHRNKEKRRRIKI